MRIALAFVWISFLFAGCTTTQTSSKTEAQIMADYRSIRPGMTQDEVLAQLGAPDHADKDGNLQWVQRPAGTKTSIQLEVSFGDDRRVLTPRIHVHLASQSRSIPPAPQAIREKALARLGMTNKALEKVLADYRSIKKGMSREEVLAQLGAPDHADKAGNLHWEQRQPMGMEADQSVALDVSFDLDGRVLEAKVRAEDESYPVIPPLPSS